MDAFQMVLQRMDPEATHKACGEVAEEQIHFLLASLAQAQDALTKIQQVVQACDSLPKVANSNVNQSASLLNSHQRQALTFAHQQLYQQCTAVGQLVTGTSVLNAASAPFQPRLTSLEATVQVTQPPQAPARASNASVRGMTQSDLGALSSHDRENHSARANALRENSWRRAESDTSSTGRGPGSDCGSQRSTGRKKRGGVDDRVNQPGVGLYEPPARRQQQQQRMATASPVITAIQQRSQPSSEQNGRGQQQEEASTLSLADSKKAVERKKQPPRQLNGTSTSDERKAHVDSTMQTMQQVSSLLSAKSKTTGTDPPPAPSADKQLPVVSTTATSTSAASASDKNPDPESPPPHAINASSKPQPAEKPNKDAEKATKSASAPASTTRKPKTASSTASEIAAVDYMMQQFSQILVRQDEANKAKLRNKNKTESAEIGESADTHNKTATADPATEEKTPAPEPQLPLKDNTALDQSPPRRRPQSVTQPQTLTASALSPDKQRSEMMPAEAVAELAVENVAEQVPIPSTRKYSTEKELRGMIKMDYSKIEFVHDRRGSQMLSLSSGAVQNVSSDPKKSNDAEDALSSAFLKSAESPLSKRSQSTSIGEKTGADESKSAPISQSETIPAQNGVAEENGAEGSKQATNSHANAKPAALKAIADVADMDDMMKRFSAILQRQEVEQKQEKDDVKSEKCTSQSPPVACSTTDPLPLSNTSTPPPIEPTAQPQLQPLAAALKTSMECTDEPEPEKTPVSAKGSMSTIKSKSTTSAECSAADEMMKHFARVLSRPQAKDTKAPSAAPLSPVSATPPEPAIICSPPPVRPSASAPPSENMLSPKDEMFNRFKQVTPKRPESAPISVQDWAPPKDSNAVNLNPFAVQFAPMPPSLPPTMPPGLAYPPSNSTTPISPYHYATAPTMPMVVSMPMQYQMTMQPMATSMPLPLGTTVFPPPSPPPEQDPDDEEDADGAFANTTFGFSPSGLLT